MRNDALDSASKYDDKKQELEFNQFGGSLGGPIVSNSTFFFGSYEGLRQTTGLSFTEAVPSDEAIRRIMAGEPVGSGGGQSADRTQAVAPLLAGSRSGTVPTANPLLALATLNTEAEQREHTRLGPRRSPLHQQSELLRAPALQRWPRRHARPHGHAAPRAARRRSR